MMSCVRVFGYPRCYGALYHNEQCCCSDAELGIKRGQAAERISRLERRLEGALERIDELERQLPGSAETKEET